MSWFVLGPLDTEPDRATLPSMSEDDPKPAASLAGDSAEVTDAATAADRANPLDAARDPIPAGRTGALPAQPVNKLYEWGAAIVIMLLLSGILFFFLSLFRGARL